MIKTYLLNHIDFKQRLEYISNRLNEEQIDYELVNMYHPNDFDYDDMIKGYEEFKNILIEITPLGPGSSPGNSYMNFSKKISPSSVSLILKHLYCWNQQLNNDYNTILILEDDADIPKGFKESLCRIYDEFIEDNMDIVMIGDGYNWHPPNIYIDRVTHYHRTLKTRCTHAYLISKSCAKKMLDNFNPFNLPIDFKMNEIIQLESLRVSWYEPGIKQKKFDNENTIDR